MFSSWQDFEEFARDVLVEHNFDVSFRRVFSNEKRKFEIDVVGERLEFFLCIDCKLYGKGRPRVSSLKAEARKHSQRTREFARLNGKKSIPALVTFFDDDLRREEGCIFIPHDKLNSFLLNIEYYVEWFDSKE